MRDKLIELIDNNKACDFECDCYECQYSDEPTCFSVRLADALIANGVTFSDVPETNVGKWIPVSERLPIVEWEKRHKDTGSKVYRCLIYRQSFMLRNTFYMTFGFFDGKRFIDIDTSSPIGNLVTHWMPMPEPPKEGE